MTSDARDGSQSRAGGGDDSSAAATVVSQHLVVENQRRKARTLAIQSRSIDFREALPISVNARYMRSRARPEFSSATTKPTPAAFRSAGCAKAFSRTRSTNTRSRNQIGGES
jgi:hypothetical protein